MIKKIALIGGIVLFTFLLIYCTTDESTIIGPFGNASKYISVTNFSADKTMLYSNGDTTVVSIKVLDVDKTPAIGLIVSFSAQFGKITESDTTDSSGIALATFISDNNTGENIITVDTGVKKHTLTLRVVHYEPKYVEMFSSSPVLLADGQATAKITTVLKDSVGKPMPNITVKFSTTLGTLSSHIEITNEEGIAITELTSANSNGTAVVTATSFVKDSVEVEFKQYVPVDIDIIPGTYTLLADGLSSTEITAIPRDDQGRKMPNIPVYFNTNKGSLSSSIVNTESDGIAKTTLTSTTDEGEAQVDVTSSVTKSVVIKFQKYVAAFLDLSAGSPIVLADGEKGTTITAVLKDSTGKRMEYETVRFSTTLGTLSSTIEQTDQDGTAKVELTSSTVPGTALVIATSFVSDSVKVDFSINVPNAIDMSASPSIILADGMSKSTITAIPKDANGNTMPGISVQFSTTLGTLSETIKITDADGVATTVLTSGTTEGTAWVTATSSISSQYGVQLIAYNPAYISLSTDVDGNTLLGDGISEINIIAEVYNSANEIIPWALVDFSTTHGTLLNNTTVRANQDGKAVIVLRSSGSASGDDAIVTAEVQGTSISETISIRFRGISMTTYVDSSQFAEGGYYKVFVRSELLDVDESVVIENASVAFSSTIGLMQPETDITDEFGRVFSIMYAEATGANQNGLVITPELFHADNINDPTPTMVIPGVEALISTVDGEVMGDGVGWALVKATLRETTGKAITETELDWETTLGTIKGKWKTNTTGHAIDTLRIENSVSTNTNVTVTAKFGDNISASDI
ncbi:MAG: hypothetical protein GWP19_09960, partial [Planctomycetia bacterium]|nr:hypothetical protein [Planctomycetia bacterium]